MSSHSTLPKAYANPHGEPVMVGMIGGTGVYALECLQNKKFYDMDTPFGKPSCDVCVAELEGITCAFLPRHGLGHTLNPSEVNYRANICAMKQLGVKYLLTINAVGSLDARYRVGDIVVVNQFIDRTVKRESTFFSNGIVAHVDFAHPTSEKFSQIAFEALKKCFANENVIFFEKPPLESQDALEKDAEFRVHASGTVVVIEGPAFSTKAESLLHKNSGGHLIGMTSCPEAKLAREAEMAYVTVAMVTDMDAWSEVRHVDVSCVLKALKVNAERAQRYPPAIICALKDNFFEDPAHNALKYAILGNVVKLDKEVKERVKPLLDGKYLEYEL